MIIGTTRALLEAHKSECLADRDRTRQCFDEVRRAQGDMETRMHESQLHMHAENCKRFDHLEAMSSRAMLALIGLLMSVIAFGVEHFMGKYF